MSGLTTHESVFINHIFGCEDCFPRSDRYCLSGREMWINHNVEFFLSVGDRDKRKREMDALKAESPKYAGEIEARFIKEFSRLRIVK